MSSNYPSLMSLFKEGSLARLLKEEDDSGAHESGASGESLDAQVDRYFGEYETAAKKADGDVEDPSTDQMESIDWRDLVKGRVLSEAPEDDPPPDAGDAAPGAAAMTGDDDTKPGLDKLDVEKFANDVARLIQNYDSLLEVRSTLLRRAKTFLAKNYSDDVVNGFEDTMRDDHAMEAGTSSEEIDDTRFTSPAADRANGNAEAGPGGAPALPCPSRRIRSRQKESTLNWTDRPTQISKQRLLIMD